METRGVQRPGRAILGGSFNPPHVGHLRLAVEAREALSHLVQGVDLVPCAQPPHKNNKNNLAMKAAVCHTVYTLSKQLFLQMFIAMNIWSLV